MARSSRHVTLDDLPPAYRAQALAQLRATPAGAEPAPICSSKVDAPKITEWSPADFASDLQRVLRKPDAMPAAPAVQAKKVRGARKPNKTETRFNLTVLGGKGLFEALSFRVEGGRYTPDFLVVPKDPSERPTCYEVKGAHAYPSENRARFAFLTCRARFPFIRFRWFRLAKGGRWTEEHLS